jgi:protein-disulfide isomerase
MLRTLFLLSLLTCTLCSFAQVRKPQSKAAAIKAAVKKDSVDYEHVGSPMPRLLLIAYYDTSNAPVMNSEMIIKDSVAHRRLKKRDKTLVQNKDKKRISNEDVQSDANLLVMMFNPLCSHCEDMTQLFEKNIALFDKSKLVMLSTMQMRDYLPNFVRSFRTAEYPSIIIGSDSSDFMEKTFLYQALPQINIYNADRKLIRSFTGDTEIDSLKQYIQ